MWRECAIPITVAQGEGVIVRSKACRIVKIESTRGGERAGVCRQESQHIARCEDYIIQEENLVVRMTTRFLPEKRLEGKIAKACEVGDASDLLP